MDFKRRKKFVLCNISLFCFNKLDNRIEFVARDCVCVVYGVCLVYGKESEGMIKLKAILSRTLGIIFAIILIYFVGPIVKSFYAYNPIIAILVLVSVVGLGVYGATRDTKAVNSEETEVKRESGRK